MPLSEATQHLLAALRNESFAGEDTCTALSEGIMRLWGTGIPRTNLAHDEVMDAFRFGSAEDGLYELRIDMGVPDDWQHGLVVLKHEGDLALLHGWRRRFSLRDWLDPANGKDIAVACFERFSPVSAIFDPTDMAFWFGALNALGLCYDTSLDLFSAQCATLFGVTLHPLDNIAYGNARRRQAGFRFVWSFRRLDPRVYEAL